MTSLTSIPLNPKSGTATMSILGNLNSIPKYSSKKGSAAAVSWNPKLMREKR